MPSFLIRGLARYFAASAMESRTRRQSSYTPSSDSSSDDSKELSSGDLLSWQTQMRWLLPFVQATGYRVVINNPKSHEQIVIDQDTKELPELTLEWMQKYDRQKLLDWMAKEKEKQQQDEVGRQKKLEARRIEEARGRARFGNSFTLGDSGITDGGKKNKNTNKGNYLIPILCICVFILALIGLWAYNSPIFEQERWEKEWEKECQQHSVIVWKEEGNKHFKSKALEIIKKDLSHTLDNYQSYRPIETKMYSMNLVYLGDTLIKNLTAAINEANYVIYKKREEEEEIREKYRRFIGTEENSYKDLLKLQKASSAVRHAEQERKILVDSLSFLVKKKGQKSPMLGWKVNHVFHQNGSENYFDDKYTYYLDKDCSRILLRLCGGGNQTLHVEDGYYYWSDDYIEIANRLYEEAHE